MSGMKEPLDQTNHKYTEYLRVAEYTGLDMNENVEEIEGWYWCQVRIGNDERTTILASNVLEIDTGIDYTQLRECESIVIEEVLVQEETMVQESDCSVYVEAFVPLVTLGVITIVLLVVSNVVFVVLWRKWYKAGKDDSIGKSDMIVVKQLKNIEKSIQKYVT